MAAEYRCIEAPRVCAYQTALAIEFADRYTGETIPPLWGTLPPVSLLASGKATRWILRMALFGSLAALRAQAPQTAGFVAAFTYLDELMRPDSTARARLRAISRGEAQRIELREGAFAMEQVYETKPRAEGFFESHRTFIDLQVIVEGEELMEVVDVSRIALRESYVQDRDLATYLDAADASQLRLRAGEAAVFFPVDVHMPSLRVGAEPALVRKSVVKVPVG
jgi:YhcH/YjgK/YiaL family protein